MSKNLDGEALGIVNATFNLNEKSIQISLYSMFEISLPITFKNESFS